MRSGGAAYKIYRAAEFLDKPLEALAVYLPIGGGAEGRGGSTSGKADNVGSKEMCSPLEKGQAEGRG